MTNKVVLLIHLLATLIMPIAVLLLSSCSTKRVELPDYEGVDIREIISDRSSIESIEATFSVEFEKNDSTMTGDAALELTDEILDLRIYSMGFLVAEITESDGIVKCNPPVSKTRSAILVNGLRSGFFWWQIKDYELEEQNGTYQLRNSQQKILIDKKTMLPTYQAIELDNGRELRIFYDNPVNSGGFWHASKMRIEMSKYVVRLDIKSLSFLPRPDQGQQQQHL